MKTCMHVKIIFTCESVIFFKSKTGSYNSVHMYMKWSLNRSRQSMPSLFVRNFLCTKYLYLKISQSQIQYLSQHCAISKPSQLTSWDSWCIHKKIIPCFQKQCANCFACRKLHLRRVGMHLCAACSIIRLFKIPQNLCYVYFASTQQRAFFWRQIKDAFYSML
jgi:hypothetical protein